MTQPFTRILAILKRVYEDVRQRPLSVLVLAALVRLPYMTGVGHTFDLTLFATYGKLVNEIGLFQIYVYPPVDYPPLYLAVLGIIDTLAKLLGSSPPTVLSTIEVFLFKVPPVLGDMLIIALAYTWLKSKQIPARMTWFILILLALYPGMILNSAWWGQFESLYTALLILSLIALEQDKPLASWAFWAFGLIIKFQSIVLLPLLVAHTLRQWGSNRLLQGVGISSVIFAGAIALFVVGSGWSGAGRPYTSTTSSYPYITVNAYNFWYAITLGQGNMRPDGQAFLSVLTYKQVGLALLGAYTLWLCIIIWRQIDHPRLFVWAAALFLGFFMLPTEIHERYLYPAAILIVLATAQQRRLLVVGIGLALTLAFNLLAVTEPLPFFGGMIHPTSVWLTVFVALANVVLFLTVTFECRRPQSHLAQSQIPETASG